MRFVYLCTNFMSSSIKLRSSLSQHVQPTVVKAVGESHHVHWHTAAIGTVEHSFLSQFGIKGNLPQALEVECIKENQASLITQRSRCQEFGDRTYIRKCNRKSGFKRWTQRNQPPSYIVKGVVKKMVCCLLVSVSTCSVVWDPWIDDINCLVWLGEVHLVRVGLEGFGQSPTVSFLQAHLPLHHHSASYLHPLFTGKVPLQETLLPGHPSLYKRAQKIVLPWLFLI